MTPERQKTARYNISTLEATGITPVEKILADHLTAALDELDRLDHVLAGAGKKILQLEKEQEAIIDILADYEDEELRKQIAEVLI